MNLKIGGSNVGKIMYNGQEFGGATKLEPGTILYAAGTQLSVINNDSSIEPNETRAITFHNVGKHWEGLKKIRFYYKNEYTTGEQVFDVNSIDEPTRPEAGWATVQRERSSTDEPDKFLVTALKTETMVIIEVEEWN